MKINPDSQRIQNPIDATAPSSQSAGSFKAALTQKVQQLGQTDAANPLASLGKAVTKADLADPTKTDAIVDHALNAIIDKEFGNMGAADRVQVVSWLRGDPLMRQTLLKHINSLAS